MRMSCSSFSRSCCLHSLRARWARHVFCTTLHTAVFCSLTARAYMRPRCPRTSRCMSTTAAATRRSSLRQRYPTITREMRTAARWRIRVLRTMNPRAMRWICRAALSSCLRRMKYALQLAWILTAHTEVISIQSLLAVQYIFHARYVLWIRSAAMFSTLREGRGFPWGSFFLLEITASRCVEVLKNPLARSAWVVRRAEFPTTRLGR
mmetsp:Transcript_90872/g.243367  ORF Transcript_90872/g.243367 Transcript_90872/m.243367 type:complete len:207 (-) Transcript_90872:1524-2144(-)